MNIRNDQFLMHVDDESDFNIHTWTRERLDRETLSAQRLDYVSGIEPEARRYPEIEGVLTAERRSWGERRQYITDFDDQLMHDTLAAYTKTDSADVPDSPKLWIIVLKSIAAFVLLCFGVGILAVGFGGMYALEWLRELLV